MRVLDPYTLSAAEIARLLIPGAANLPELEAARRDLAALRRAPQTAVLLAETEQHMAGPAHIPPTTYSAYRQFRRTGDRQAYQGPYFERRSRLTATALRSFLAPQGPCLESADHRPATADGRHIFIRRGPEPGVKNPLDVTLSGSAGQVSASQTASEASHDSQRDASARTTGLGMTTVTAGLGQDALKDLVQDHLWAICEETNWVVPAHEIVQIDIMAAETGLLLAETLALLGDALDAEVCARVRGEIERRIFEPYLRFHGMHWWHTVHHNWNAVCNSAIAATFLWLEPEPGRTARALEIAFAGLREYLAYGFEADGTCTEGVGYWHYGLINFVLLAEMLRSRSGGALDLLAGDRMRTIAAYPAKLLLSGTQFAAFADCDETLAFYPGVMARLAERAGEPSLLGLIAPADGRAGAGSPRPCHPHPEDWRLPMALRDLLWWDGAPRPAPPVTDAYLPAGGIARLVAATADGTPVALAIQAGHNGVNHNHNDVGGFVLHIGGENLLTDPGRPLYTRQFFGPERYDNIFANSYGHNVPRIGGVLQAAGRQYEGRFVDVALNGSPKHVEIEFARAYPLPGLVSVRRTLMLDETGVLLHDRFCFADDPLEVEEAFVTWAEVALAQESGIRSQASGGTADTYHLTPVSCLLSPDPWLLSPDACLLSPAPGCTLRMTIEAPAGATWRVEALEEQCRQNARPGVLKRLTFTLPVAGEVEARVRMEIIITRNT